MSKARTEIIGGVACLLLGLVLWQVTSGLDTPLVTLPKIGVVLMLVGGGGLLYGLFIALRAR